LDATPGHIHTHLGPGRLIQNPPGRRNPQGRWNLLIAEESTPRLMESYQRTNQSSRSRCVANRHAIGPPIRRPTHAFRTTADVDYESQLRSSYNLKRLTPYRGDEEENHRKRPRSRRRMFSRLFTVVTLMDKTRRQRRRQSHSDVRGPTQGPVLPLDPRPRRLCTCAE